MKKKLFVLALIAAALLSPFFISAQDRIIDNSGLISAAEKAAFEKAMEEIASSHNFNLMILNENDIGVIDPIDYSWNYLDAKGLGGETWDGCLLLLVTGKAAGDRDYCITASGRGSKILNRTAYARLESKVLSHLINNDFAGAYGMFIDIWEEYLILDAKGRSYNFFTQNNLIMVLAAWIISLLIGIFVVMKWKADMNTALPQTEADAYIIPGSLAFTVKQDKFLYSTVTKTKRQQQTSSSGGGSSRSGGGRSSRSGKF